MVNFVTDIIIVTKLNLTTGTFVTLVNVSGKVVSVHTTKACRGSRGRAPLINLGVRWR
jgi:hypothetical protein